VDPKELPAGMRPLYHRVLPRPAKDGLVLFVTWKALADAADAPLAKKDLLVDRLWASKGEADALAAGKLSDRLKQRLAAHVADVFMSKVASVDVQLRDQRLSGSVLLANGEHCAALGRVVAKDGKIQQLDLLIKGMIVGTGREENGGFPSIGLLPVGQKRPAVLAFQLADPRDELAKVLPGSGKDLGGGAEK
jgi:hypothetical protein